MSYVSHADLGGAPDDRPVRLERDEPVFHADWEARALALTLAAGACGHWNIDMSRSARETLPDYASLSYYQIWLAALERLLVARQWVQPDELGAGHALHPAAPVRRVLRAEQVTPVLAAGSPTSRPAEGPARFAVGQQVRACAQRPDHHTRLPGYAMGHVGWIEHIHGVHVFPDANAQGLGELPQWLYRVVFDRRELFGGPADADAQVAIDAWESYLSPIEDTA